MGKYMKKAKIPGDVDSMEISGVRTRAKTLALQRLQSPEDSSYLQLRSRRLEKPSTPKPKSGTKKETASPDNDFGIEASFGENFLDCEPRNRSTRETTPCSLIRDSEFVRTPGSSTKPTDLTSTFTRVRNQTCRIMPTTNEMEEFFTMAEQVHQKNFRDKYNFDLVAGVPLPGRFEWVKVDD